MSCHICGAPGEPDRICVTNQGRFLCPECFAEFLKRRREKRERAHSGEVPRRNRTDR